MMKNLIIERIKFLQKEKEYLKVLPSNPNEFELHKDISDLFKKELDCLIALGKIDVVGHTIGKNRILKI